MGFEKMERPFLKKIFIFFGRPIDKCCGFCYNN